MFFAEKKVNECGNAIGISGFCVCIVYGNDIFRNFRSNFHSIKES